MYLLALGKKVLEKNKPDLGLNMRQIIGTQLCKIIGIEESYNLATPITKIAFIKYYLIQDCLNRKTFVIKQYEAKDSFVY